MLSLVHVYGVFGPEVSYARNHGFTVFAERHDEALDYVGGLGGGLAFVHLHAQQIHYPRVAVLFLPVYAEICIDFAGKFVHLHVFAVS